MKNVKKIVGLLVVLAMAICMTIPAYAAGEGSITIENYDANETYTAYKLFDVVYDQTGGNYAYTITSDSPWFAYINAYAADASKGLVLTQVNGGTLYTVTFTDAFRAADLANLLADDADASKGGIAFTSETLSNLELGYYYVTTTSGALCNLTTTDPDETIYDKNETPTITKEASDTEVEVGQTITYTIKGELPSTTGYDTYLYNISDTLGTGLTLNKDSLVLTIAGQEMDLAEGENLTFTANGFKVGGDIAGPMQAEEAMFKAGDEVVLTYTATINEDAFNVNEITNNAVLEFSNDPNNAAGTTTSTATADEDIYVANIVVDKYAIKANAEDKSEKLDGAEFKLYKLDENGAKVYYKWNATDKKVEWVAEADADVLTTDDNGAATFYGIQPDDAIAYYLEEVKAPDGYNRLAAPVAVTVKVTFNEAEEFTGISGNTVSVGNQAGFLLPSTGGMGTTIFYIVGTVLIAGAFILIVTKKRMSTEK